MDNDIKPELTTESVSRMIDIAIWKSETRILERVKKAILANNQRILEQLREAGILNQE
jgi:hypothetical protein